MTIARSEQYGDHMARLYPELFQRKDGDEKRMAQSVTFQVTDDCNLACFIAGTKILMSDFSHKNIEDVKIGDVVMAFPEHTPKNKQLSLYPTKVTHTFIRHGSTRTITTTDGDSVTCTDEHPFLNGRKQWIRAEKIKAKTQKLTKYKGDCNFYGTSYFKRQDVESVEISNEYVTVYNLETESHTYIANNFAVHNCKYCLSGDTQIRMADYSLKSIKDVELGDEILGYEEYPEKGKQTKVIKATVDQLFQRNSKVLNMRFSTGESIQITPNHKILVRRNSHDNRYDYMEAGKLKPGDSVYYLPIIDKNFDIVCPNFDRDYKIGYLIAMIQGDGSLKHYNRKNDGCDVFKFRIAVKDIEIIERCKSYLDDLNIPVYLKPFKVSEKHNLWQNAIFSNMRYTYNSLKNLIEDHFQKTKSVSYYQGYLAGIYDAEGHISKERVIRICNTDYEIIKEIAEGLDLLKIPYIIECDNKGTVNKDKKFNVRITDNLNAISSYRFIKSVSPSIPRKCFEQFLNYAPLKKAKIISITESGTEVPVYNIGTSSHTYIANGIAVHNCYQINKGKRRMSLETAKKFVDLLLDSTPENNSYINPEKSPFIILDFIGGEPLLEVDLIDEIVTYFMEETFNRMHPWADRFRVSLCSNGVLYFEPNVQRFLKKHRNHLSLSITIDGNKELHDSCRVFHDGRPSYDLAVAAAKDWMDNYGDMGSKITIAPENIEHVYEALVHMVELGYTEINANCVFEEGWEREHAIELYAQMKRFADYLIDNDLQDTIYCSLFEEVFFKPMPDERNDNWCWGEGTPVLTVDGYKPIEEIKIGDLVYTEDGSIHPVIRTTSHMADNCVKISASGVFEMTCTTNHKLFAKPFDYLGWKGKKHYKSYDRYEVKHLKQKDLIQLFKLPNYRSVDYNVDIAYLVGRYLGDGWHSTTGHKICSNYTESDYLRKMLDKAKIYYSTDDYPTVQQFNIFKKNSELVRILSLCGDNAAYKHLPSECFSWTDSALNALLRGYMDSDGTINKHGQYRFNTISQRLACEMMIILRTLGFTPTCYKNLREGKSQILGREVNIKNRYEVYFYKDVEKTKYVKHLGDKVWTSNFKKFEAESQMVYNLTVDGNHSYIAGGIVSSNCGGTGVMLSCDPDGYLYPCIRYMESSLGEEQPPIRIGHVDTGLVTTEEEKQTVKCLKCITRRSQSTDECYYCPIADGCAWCFPAGTKVSTPDGLVNIEELKTGDMVLDKDGNTQRVYRNLERKNDGLVYVKAAGLYDLLTTKEHPFWCKSVIKRNNNIPTYGDPRWVPAGNLKTEDRIALFVPKPGDEDVDKNYAYLLGHNFTHRQSEYVSRSLWNWNLDSIKAFLRGIFDTDKRFEKSQDSIRLLSASLELTLNISELVRMVYHVNVSIRKHEADNMYECVWEPDVSSTREYYDFDERNSIMWVNVSPSKKDVPAEATVFNLSVENNPTFIANGAIVHNCSAYNYQVFGTVDKRATFICEMHKARSLANVYFWNKVYEKEGKDKKFPMHCPKEWAIPIIGEKEYSYLLKLSEGGNHEDQNR